MGIIYSFESNEDSLRLENFALLFTAKEVVEGHLEGVMVPLNCGGMVWKVSWWSVVMVINDVKLGCEICERYTVFSDSLVVLDPI